MKLRIGILTTFNQRCGLATYAAYLSKHFSHQEIVLLAEDVPATERLNADPPNLRRCWKRLATDFSNLKRALDEERVGVLHINCHHRFFNCETFSDFLRSYRRSGGKVILQVHNPYTLDRNLQMLLSVVDATVVHTPENKLEMIANGAIPAHVHVIEHGVDLVQELNQAQCRQALSVPAESKMVVCFGFVQQHKGIDQVITAVQQLNEKGEQIRLYIVGGPHAEDPTSIDYQESLERYVRDSKLEQTVYFERGFVSDQRVRQFLIAADTVVMNYRSQYHEASGALSLALGCGAAVIASSAPAFSRYRDAVFHVTSGYPLPLALLLVLKNETLQLELRSNAKRWATDNSWQNTAKRFGDLYQRYQGTQHLFVGKGEDTMVQNESGKNKRTVPQLRVLMQNRPNALTQRGGDTVVMEKLTAGLRARGVTVDIDLEARAKIESYDLVHLFNFATPEITEQLARRVDQAGVPFVVTTMYEDLPCFYNQKVALFQALQQYLALGQPRERWDDLLVNLPATPRSSRWENRWTAEHAALLLASGERERRTLLRDYSGAQRVEVYALGTDLISGGIDATLFERETGLSDFVLCVGRLETRKNQLMLLRALEDSELTVVFATGGFTYQPEYEVACRKYRRRGKTHFFGHLSPEMLASAYQAARTHVLPSFYELPGIVSLEAARFGKNIVVTNYGTAKDYFGDLAYYCEPTSVESIYAATMAAYYAPQVPEMKQRVEEFTWDKAAEQILTYYSQIVRVNVSHEDAMRGTSTDYVKQALERANETVKTATASVEVLPLSSFEPGKSESNRWCDEADHLLRENKANEARVIYQRAMQYAPSDPRPTRSIGILHLAQGEYLEAAKCFEKVLCEQPQDSKSLTGLAMCWSAQGRQTDAWDLLKRALASDPANITAIHKAVELGYALNCLDDLERILTRYVQCNPKDYDIQYCLAGCLFRQGELEAARLVVDQILLAQPEHENAMELKNMLGRSAAKVETRGVTQYCHSSIDEQLANMEREKKDRNYEFVMSQAETVVADGRATDDQKALARVLKGEALSQVGRLTDADIEFALAEGSVQSRVRAITGRGVIAAALERWHDAENYFTKATLLEPDNDVALAGLGICAGQRNDQDEAWRYYERALTKNPENKRALLGIVQLGYPLKRLSETERALEKYLEIHPADLSMLYAHAGCCYAQGKRGIATTQLEKIRLFEPEHKLANELMAKIGLDERQKGTSRSI